MSARKEPPFPRGATLGVTTTSDGTGIEGTIWEFEDYDYSVSPAVLRSNLPVKCMAVRNVSTVVIQGKRAVTLQASTTNRIKRIDGYASVTAVRSFLTDEFLPLTGIPINDIGYVVLEGTAKATMPSSQIADISDGDVLVAATVAASTGNSAGHVTPMTATAATAAGSINPILNRIGFALSAVSSSLTYTGTTVGTTSDVLVHVTKW